MSGGRLLDRRSAVCLLAVVGAATLLDGCGFESVATKETRNETMSFDLGEAKTARVRLRMGGGQLHVGG